jgi:2,4-dienoyl-CoA reductase-like NADH-dependent reductase (Old Yellow Enzyme family)
MDRNDPVFQPIRIGPKTAQNRFVINAMECCDSDEEGNPTEKTYRRYRNLFEGQAGLVDLEAITVQWESRSRKTQLSAMPRNQKALEKFTRELRKVNGKTLFVWQLTHSGELSNPEFGRRVCVKPLPGFGGDVID